MGGVCRLEQPTWELGPDGTPHVKSMSASSPGICLRETGAHVDEEAQM